MAVSMSYDPTLQTPLGLTARVAPAWDSEAMSRAGALSGRNTMGGMRTAGSPPVGVRRARTAIGQRTSEEAPILRILLSRVLIVVGVMAVAYGATGVRGGSGRRGFGFSFPDEARAILTIGAGLTAIGVLGNRSRRGPGSH